MPKATLGKDGKLELPREFLERRGYPGDLECWVHNCRFRREVQDFHFPSCPDCDLRDGCDFREKNEACWGWNPSCADCLWAQDIVRCP